MRIHLCIGVAVLLLGRYYSLSKGDWCLLILCIGLVLAMELLNTAVERVVDLTCRDCHPLARLAKDAAAGAVLVSAIAAAVVGILLFSEPAGITHFLSGFIQPLPLICRVLFIAAAVLFISLPVPKREKNCAK